MLARLLPFLLILGACNEAVINDTGGPCLGADCGRSCSEDVGCDSRTYCSPSGSCTADCSPGDNRCAAGTTCGFHGRCLPVPLQDGGACPNVNVTVKPIIPLVQLLIDQSGSMTGQFGSVNGRAMTRWEAVRYALTDQTAGAVTGLADRVRFGATLYNSLGGSLGGVCPLLTRSAGQPAGIPLLANRAAIDDLLTKNSPARDTPTAESVDAVSRDIQEYARALDPMAPRVLILATDGDPDTCANPDANGDPASQALSEKAVQNAFTAGVRTYVLSVGTDATKSHLQKLANAGAGKALSPPSEAYFQGNNPAELVSAFSSIIRGVRSCSFVLNGNVQTGGGERAVVKLNDRPLSNGVDWEIQGTRTLVLKGAACDSFKNSDRATLSAEFACGTILF